MSENTRVAKSDPQVIFQDLVGILENMTSDWDTSNDGGITPQTRLIADLGFESIDVVQLVVAVEEKFQSRSLPFEQLLMADGRYVDELRVGEIADFLSKNLGGDA